MTARLKVDDGGDAILEDGKPVVIIGEGDDAREMPLDVNFIEKLNDDAAKHRHRAKDLESRLKEFGNISPAAAKAALEAVKDIEADKGNGKAADKDFESLKAQMQAQLTSEKRKLQDEIRKRDRAIEKMMITDRFATSTFVRDKMIDLPPDMVAQYFNANFKVETNEDGSMRVVGVNEDKTPIMSSSRMGETATFDEALETLVRRSPNAGKLLRAKPGGSGAVGGAAPGGLDVSKPWINMGMAEKAAYVKAHGADAAKQKMDSERQSAE